MTTIPQNTLDLLYNVLQRLQNSGHRWAIIHNADSLAEAIDGDIDLALDDKPTKIMMPIITDLEKEFGAKLVQCLHYDVPHGYYFIIHFSNDYLHLDCLYDPRGLSRYHLSTNRLLHNYRTSSGLNYVNKENELEYTIIKRSLKGNIENNLHNIVDQLPSDPATNRRIKKWTGDNNFDQMVGLSADDIDSARPLFSACRAHIQRHYRTKHPAGFFIGKIYTLGRLVKRYFNPTGILVVIVGPDGCGKSTINHESTARLQRAFRKTWSFHWRPGLLPRPGKSSAAKNFSSDAPNTESKYKGPISYLRFAYYWLDFVIGYWLIVHTRKAQTTFIVSERYYLDILVHPERYGFSCPRWLIKLGGIFVPKPDLTVLLSAEPQLIHNRKPELPVEVISQQIDDYKTAIGGWGKSKIIDTSTDIQESTDCFVNEVLEICASKLRKKVR